MFHSRVENRIIPVTTIGDIGDGQDNILLREIQYDSRIQSVDVGLDDSRAVDRRKIALIEYGIHTDIFEYIAGKVAEDEQGI
jgi:hypothetical protein